MKQIVKFTVYGEPIGKERPRFSSRGGKAVAYTPQKTSEYERQIKNKYMDEYDRLLSWSSDDAMSIMIKAYFKIPKSDSRAVRQAKLEGKIRPTKKPDADNILKIVADALNDEAYADDRCIVSAQVEKWYSDEPRIEVIVERLQERLQSGKENDNVAKDNNSIFVQ